MDGEIPKELLASYYASIPEKLALLRQLINNYKEKQGIEELKAFRFVLHKLEGSAAVYGFTEVSKICHEANAATMKWETSSSEFMTTQIINGLEFFYERIEKNFTPPISL
ncbi:MAG: Hpt domain-containing protein [Verrucomicrobiota bacterium]|nr:Hpt domain-containing protein [Verrucomicrobiota bacterium]